MLRCAGGRCVHTCPYYHMRSLVKLSWLLHSCPPDVLCPPPPRLKPNQATYRTAIAALREAGALAEALALYQGMRRHHPADNSEFEGLTAVAAEWALAAEDAGEGPPCLCRTLMLSRPRGQCFVVPEGQGLPRGQCFVVPEGHGLHGLETGLCCRLRQPCLAPRATHAAPSPASPTLADLRRAVAEVCGITSAKEVDLHGMSGLEARAAVLCVLGLLQVGGCGGGGGAASCRGALLCGINGHTVRGVGFSVSSALDAPVRCASRADCPLCAAPCPLCLRSNTRPRAASRTTPHSSPGAA